MKTIKCWIEAMRLRTLPVSLAGVVMAVGFNLLYGNFMALPAVYCFIFALLAQIASNFANEYYDFKSGLDRPGREGPRRGVTEGDITPVAMKTATYLTLLAAGCVGCALLPYGGVWLLAAGLLIAIGALMYSTGPYPLSHHCLGEVAVLLFFGVIPVNLTYYVQSLQWDPEVVLASLSVGLMGANVLIVNNYRDRDDDSAVGKNTLAVKYGLRAMSGLYLINGLVAPCLMFATWREIGGAAWLVPAAYVVLHCLLWRQLRRRNGAALTPVLGMTAMLMFAYSLAFLLFAAF